MTFKHTKFEDSATMRSLVKVAAEKGWIKPEKIEKTASVEEDRSITNNLTQNVFKLCAGLRQSGMHKAADELEAKFVVYRQANAMYGVHKEEGEDLVDAAHPKGGHKMENIEGDAFVETILDKHLKMLDVVNKKPTGKLASHKDILNAVKVVLADDSSASAMQGLISSAEAKYKELIAAVHTPDQSSQSNMARIGTIGPIYKAWKNDAGGPTPATVTRGLQAIETARSRLVYGDPAEVERLKKLYESNSGTQEDHFHYLSMTNSYSNWQKIETLLNDLKGILGNMQKTLTAGDLGIVGKIDAQIKRLDKTFRSLLQDPGFTEQDRKDGNAEIDGFIKVLNAWKAVLQGVDEADKATEAAK